VSATEGSRSTAPAGGDVPELPELPEASRWVLEVSAVAPITPAVTRIRLVAFPADGGERPLVHAPGQDLSLTVPGPHGSSVNRRYTIDAYDVRTGTVDLAIVTHGDGPGARWLASASPGDRVEALGPRGKITLGVGASTHLFVGDEASLAAIGSIAGAIPAGGRAIVLADVADEHERRPIAVAPGASIEVCWIERGDERPESPARVIAELRGIEIPSDDTHAYLFGEMRVVAGARALLGERLDPSRISPKPYWRAGRPNADRGEPDRDQ